MINGKSEPTDFGFMRVMIHALNRDQVKHKELSGEIPNDSELKSVYCWIDTSKVSSYYESGQFPGQTAVQMQEEYYVALMDLPEFHSEFWRVKTAQSNTAHGGGNE